MKIAIVTGASSGIGKEFIMQLADDESLDQIWAIARRYDRLNQLQTELPSLIRPLALDLLRPESLYTIRSLLASENPEVSVLVNAAGFGKYGTYLDLSEEEINQIIDLNCKAGIHMTYACLPYMHQHSRVIMLGSSSAYQPLPEFNIYASAKVFIVHFSRALNMELKERSITVTAVCPGYVRTEFFLVAQNGQGADKGRRLKPMYEAADVVKKALLDSKKGRDMSVLGFQIKLLRLLSKILPHRLVMKVWLSSKNR